MPKVKKIYVAFTGKKILDSIQGSWFRKWLARKTIEMGGEYVHVEYIFKFYDEAPRALIVYDKHPVQFVEIGGEHGRDYFKHKWTFFEMQIRDQEIVQNIFEHCCLNVGKPFASWRILINFHPWIPESLKISNNGNSWFCSELCMAALQYAVDDFDKCKAYLTTPWSFYTFCQTTRGLFIFHKPGFIKTSAVASTSSVQPTTPLQKIPSTPTLRKSPNFVSKFRSRTPILPLYRQFPYKKINN